MATEAQKQALKRYYEKNKDNQKRITISMNAEEYANCRTIMKEHNVTPLQVWRDAIERLKTEPTNGERV